MRHTQCYVAGAFACAEGRTVAARSVGNARNSFHARSIIEGAAMAHNVPSLCVSGGLKKTDFSINN
jgi:hypothetical protein